MREGQDSPGRALVRNEQCHGMMDHGAFRQDLLSRRTVALARPLIMCIVGQSLGCGSGERAKCSEGLQKQLRLDPPLFR